MSLTFVFNPLTGQLDLVDKLSSSSSTDHHAGWGEILSGETVTIASRKQMRVNGTFSNSGTLINNGTLVLD